MSLQKKAARTQNQALAEQQVARRFRREFLAKFAEHLYNAFPVHDNHESKLFNAEIVASGLSVAQIDSILLRLRYEFEVLRPSV